MQLNTQIRASFTQTDAYLISYYIYENPNSLEKKKKIHTVIYTPQNIFLEDNIPDLSSMLISSSSPSPWNIDVLIEALLPWLSPFVDNSKSASEISSPML